MHGNGLIFLFSLVNPRNVELVNLSRGFYSDEIVVRAELKHNWLYIVNGTWILALVSVLRD